MPIPAKTKVNKVTEQNLGSAFKYDFISLYLCYRLLSNLSPNKTVNNVFAHLATASSDVFVSSFTSEHKFNSLLTCLGALEQLQLQWIIHRLNLTLNPEQLLLFVERCHNNLLASHNLADLGKLLSGLSILKSLHEITLTSEQKVALLRHCYRLASAQFDRTDRTTALVSMTITAVGRRPVLPLELLDDVCRKLSDSPGTSVISSEYHAASVSDPRLAALLDYLDLKVVPLDSAETLAPMCEFKF